MKLLCFILSLFSLLSTKVYITQKEKFLNTINSAYEEYEVFEKELWNNSSKKGGFTGFV